MFSWLNRLFVPFLSWGGATTSVNSGTGVCCEKASSMDHWPSVVAPSRPHVQHLLKGGVRCADTGKSGVVAVTNASQSASNAG